MALWMRDEVNRTERRAPIVPVDARTLISDGVSVTVESSSRRTFGTAEYAAAGCRITESGSWPAAPEDAVIIGLKAPGAESFALRHRHVFFGHAYKGQRDGEVLLRRFAEGGGSLLDLEYLTDATGARVAAFGHWAGYVGASLAILHARGQLAAPLAATSQPALDDLLRNRCGDQISTLVIGALGRCGRGARAALAVAGIAPTCWDLPETREVDRSAILDHDVLINAVLVNEPAPAFLRPVDVDHPARRLSIIVDVTCDVTSDRNLLPIYDRPTDWMEPVCRLRAEPQLDLIAINNLPSLLPREASTEFSANLLPHLRVLDRWSPVWQRAFDRFHAATSA
jgi:saccharopine dehydrogenase (NAD+, L-lysine forming)